MAKRQSGRPQKPRPTSSDIIDRDITIMRLAQTVQCAAEALRKAGMPLIADRLEEEVPHEHRRPLKADEVPF